MAASNSARQGSNPCAGANRRPGRFNSSISSRGYSSEAEPRSSKPSVAGSIPAARSKQATYCRLRLAEQDPGPSNRSTRVRIPQAAPTSCWSMIFSENRYPPRIKCGAGFFGIMLYSGVAQLAARPTLNRQVEGSSPSPRATLLRAARFAGFAFVRLARRDALRSLGRRRASPV